MVDRPRAVDASCFEYSVPIEPLERPVKHRLGFVEFSRFDQRSEPLHDFFDGGEILALLLPAFYTLVDLLDLPLDRHSPFGLSRVRPESGGFFTDFVSRAGDGNQAVTDVTIDVECSSGGKISDDVSGGQQRQSVSPVEFFVTMCRQNQMRDTIAADVEIAFPLEPNRVCPASSVAPATEGGIASGDIRLTGHVDPDGLPIADPLCPEFPGLAVGSAADLPSAQRADIELAEVRRADDRLAKLIGNQEAFAPGVGKSLRKRRLHIDRNFKAGFEIVLLQRRVGKGFPGFVQRPANNAPDKRPFFQCRLGGAAPAGRVMAGNLNGNASVLDVGQLPARKPHVPLGGNRFFRIRKRGVSLQAVIEKLYQAPVPIEHQRPVEYLAVGVRNANSLRRRFGASDLTVKQPFRADRRIVDQPGFERDRNKIGLNASNDFTI